MSTTALDLYQQNTGVHAVNSGPIIIRTYNDLSSNNTYILGKYDIPISSNYVLTTSTNGQLVPSNSINLSGTVRSSAYVFADNSAMVSATPALDYNTFGKNWTATTLPNGSGAASSASGQYTVGTYCI